MGRVDGKVALVTGAARGMGRNHAIRLAREGADVILLDVCADLPGVAYPMATEADLAETVGEVEATGRRAFAAIADVRDRDAVRRQVDAGVAQLGGLDVVVANAGLLIAGTWDSYSDEDWQTTIDVNLGGAWNTCTAALPHIIGRDFPSIILISSMAGLKGAPLMLPYTASKFGVTGLALGLAKELAADNVRVNSVHPTGVKTGLDEPELGRLLQGGHGRLTPTFLNAMPVELVSQDDVSSAVLYLASDESRYVTGVQLKVDAGVTLG